MTDVSLERIELKIAYLEKANSELSDVVYRQQQQLDELTRRLALLASQVDEAKHRSQEYTLEDERPPHY
jgi:SlyX protein